MARDDSASIDGRHRLLPDAPAPTFTADIRNPDVSPPHIRKADDDHWREQIGRTVRTVRGPRSLKEFAADIERDERQIARWEEGKERPHFDAIFAVKEFRGPLVVALAELSGSVDVSTTIVVRRHA